MTDFLDERAFTKAMTAHGVDASGDITAEQWLAVWADYGKRRMGTFQSFVAGVADLVAALRDKLRGHKARVLDAKAALAELDELCRHAIALGADDVRLRIARQRGSLKSTAEWADFDARQVRRQATALGIDLQEGMDE